LRLKPPAALALIRPFDMASSLAAEQTVATVGFWPIAALSTVRFDAARL
jgi:hypothetical protein